MNSTHSDTVWIGLDPQGPPALHTVPSLGTRRQKGYAGSKLRPFLVTAPDSILSLRSVTLVIPAGTVKQLRFEPQPFPQIGTKADALGCDLSFPIPASQYLLGPQS